MGKKKVIVAMVRALFLGCKKADYWFFLQKNNNVTQAP